MFVSALPSVGLLCFPPRNNCLAHLRLPSPPVTQVCGWLAFTVGVQALPAALFMVAGAYQMAVWALQKHKRLKKVGVWLDYAGGSRVMA